jgi:hypothetical protein
MLYDVEDQTRADLEDGANEGEARARKQPRIKDSLFSDDEDDEV